MKKTTTILIIILLVHSCSNKIHATEQDSLLLEIGQEEDPIKRVELELKYVYQLANLSMDSAMNKADSMIVNYQKNRFDIGSGRMVSLKSWLYSRLAQYEKSVKLGHEALKIQESIDDSIGIAMTLLRIGVYNGQFNRLLEAKNYLLKALDYFIILNDSVRIDWAYNNLGIFEIEDKNYDEGVRYYKESLKIRTLRKDYHWMGFSYFNISNVFFEKEQLDSTEKYIFLSIETFKRTLSQRIPGMVSLGLAELLRKQGKYQEAIEQVNLSLEDSEKRNHVEMLIESKLLMTQLLFQVKKYKEAYVVQSEYYELKDYRDSTNSISNVIEIEEKYRLAKEQLELSKLELESSEELAQSQNYNIIISYMLLIVLGGAFFLGLIYLKQQQKRRTEKAHFNERISSLKLVALRSQMNPHFIFNCINTAQNFVLAKDTKHAYKYLSKFAQLLRLILENSNHSHTYLEDEVKQMELYLALESTRFNNQFSYEISLDQKLKNGTFEIPGMLIQPFIENAVIHGVSNQKDRVGNIRIRLDLLEDTIYCEIIDNGVGRVRANEIKMMKEKHFQSLAISNIIERLELLQENSDTSLNVEIVDLYENEVAMGTKVLLYLPFT